MAITGRWDVTILNFDGHTPIPPAEIRPGHGPRPLGSAAQVRGDVDDAFWEVDWSDPLHGVLDEHGVARLEFDLRGEEPLGSIEVHAQGAARAAELVAHLCLVNNWVALDRARGEYLDLEEPEAWVPGAAGDA